VDEAVGLFVSASGSDEGAGTKGSPLKSIGKALEKQGNKPRVYVCEGTYEERVEVKGGVTVLGGFGCADWKYTGTKSKLAPKEAGYAVVLTKVSQPVTVEDFEISAQDAAADSGGSSVAIFANESAGLTLRRVVVQAGAGANAPAVGAPATNLYSGSVNGEPASGATGGAGKTCDCKVHGKSIAGKGGDGKSPNADNGNNGAALPLPTPVGLRDSAAGAGEIGGVSLCSGGHAGADGSARKSGGASVAAGSLTGNGYSPSPGREGEAGNPGGGGGGGGGGLTDGAGAGGCGGCGGSGGLGGKGGGGSIGIAAYKTAVKLEACRVQTKAGGTGSAGGTGEAGGGGGGGTVGACSGGRGGNGAGGGGGGGGSGGISVGIVHVGKAPEYDGTTDIKPGAKGSPGGGGGGGNGGSNVLSTAPSGDTGAQGLDGISQPVLELQP
jgi:hypothetical protein